MDAWLGALRQGERPGSRQTHLPISLGCACAARRHVRQRVEREAIFSQVKAPKGGYLPLKLTDAGCP
jgi:hypothetical protein